MMIWDERLISRARAANMCGTWELKTDLPYLRCNQCDGNITMLPSGGRVINVDGLISAVLGHMVKCHDYSLSGSNSESGI